MKKRVFALLLAALLIGTMAACGASSSSGSEAVSSASAADDGQNYFGSLKAIASLESGTAGSSLKAAETAAALLSNVFVLGIPEDAYDDCVSMLKNDVSKLSDEQKGRLADNYTTTIAPLVEGILEKSDDVSGILSDAGVAESVETLLNAPDLDKYWDVFNRAMEEVLEEL